MTLASWRVLGRPTVQTAPAVEPLTAALCREQARQTLTADDTYLETQIKAARRYFEAQTGLALITQTLDATFDAFPTCQAPLFLPRGPAQSVTSITTYDQDDTASTFSSGSYALDATHAPARVYLRTGASWPTSLRAYAGIVVRYVAGFGVAADVPADIKQALLMLIAYWYTQRESNLLEPGLTPVRVPDGYQDLLALYRDRYGVA